MRKRKRTDLSKLQQRGSKRFVEALQLENVAKDGIKVGFLEDGRGLQGNKVLMGNHRQVSVVGSLDADQLMENVVSAFADGSTEFLGPLSLLPCATSGLYQDDGFAVSLLFNKVTQHRVEGDKVSFLRSRQQHPILQFLYHILGGRRLLLGEKVVFFALVTGK